MAEDARHPDSESFCKRPLPAPHAFAMSLPARQLRPESADPRMVGRSQAVRHWFLVPAPLVRIQAPQPQISILNILQLVPRAGLGDAISHCSNTMPTISTPDWIEPLNATQVAGF